MKEKPIIFSAPMILAILDGRKTQTRRPVKPQPDYPLGHDLPKCPYGEIGDRLWVKEAAYYSPVGFAKFSEGEYTHVDYDGNPRIVSYYADGRDEAAEDFGVRVSSGRFMPKWAARIWLEILDLRIEPLQSISMADIFHEGVIPPDPGSPTRHFVDLWDGIYAKIPYIWVNNPWVWVIEFKIVERDR